MAISYKLSAGMLLGANAYFTNFDHKIVAKVTDKAAFRLEVERALKILLLTKNNVVCAASHLTSDFTYSFLKDNPVLLRKEMIIPALRDDLSDMSNLFKDPETDKISFLQENVNKVVLWNLQDNSGWFREVLMVSLTNPRSIIRRNLQEIDENIINGLVAEINKRDILDRNTIDELIKNLPSKERLILQQYRELIYHISGARVVNSESTLPQENFIDYSLADVENRQIILSERQIFWKIFIELLYESILKTKIPVELLDILSYDDIYMLRQPIQESKFIETYNTLIEKSITNIHREETGDILYSIEELLSIKDSLYTNFTKHIEKELTQLIRKRLGQNFKELLKNTINIGLGFAPLTILMSGTYSIISEGRSLHLNVVNSFKNSEAIGNHKVYLQQRYSELKRVIKHSDLGDDKVLINTVQLLVSTIYTKLSF